MSILLLLFCHVGQPPNIVDAIEHNVLWRENGEHFHQYILWDNVNVVDCRVKGAIRRVSYHDGYYHLIWLEENKLYHVKSRAFKKTVTHDDKEIEDRKKGLRRGLYAEQLFWAR